MTPMLPLNSPTFPMPLKEFRRAIPSDSHLLYLVIV
jgi:hypothetical protein